MQLQKEKPTTSNTGKDNSSKSVLAQFNINRPIPKLNTQPTTEQFSIDFQLAKYKKFIDTFNVENVSLALMPRDQSLPKFIKQQILKGLTIIGAGSEGKVIQLEDSKDLCLKFYEVEQENFRVNLCNNLDPSPYLVNSYFHNQDYRLMDYIEGEELVDYLRDTVSITVSLSDQLKGLLDYVISQALKGIYINDISVYNIMVTPQGKPIIVDYDNIQDEYFQFPSFLNHSGMAHLARYFYQTIEDLNINKEHLIFCDLDYDKFGYDIPQGSWFEEYRQIYSKYEYNSQEVKLNEFYQIDTF
ncbi:MAG: hypothetical protein ABS904_00465 [Solibacillus isronensis]